MHAPIANSGFALSIQFKRKSVSSLCGYFLHSSGQEPLEHSLADGRFEWRKNLLQDFKSINVSLVYHYSVALCRLKKYFLDFFILFFWNDIKYFTTAIAPWFFVWAGQTLLSQPRIPSNRAVSGSRTNFCSGADKSGKKTELDLEYHFRLLRSTKLAKADKIAKSWQVKAAFSVEN